MKKPKRSKQEVCFCVGDTAPHSHSVIDCVCPCIAAWFVGTHSCVVYMRMWKSRWGIISMFILYVQKSATSEPVRQQGGKDGVCCMYIDF